MAYLKESKEEEAATKRPDRFTEEFTIQVSTLKGFYQLVSLLNRELGFGNWTTEGRPVRKLRRVDYYNLGVSRIQSSFPLRTHPVKFRYSKEHSEAISRVLLEFA